MCLSNGQTNSIGETLAQGPCRNFDAWSVMRLWVTWGDAVDMLRARAVSQVPVVLRQHLETYSEMLQVIHCDFVPKQMEECILEHATMTVPKRASASIRLES